MANYSSIQFHFAECITGYEDTFKRSVDEDDTDNPNNLYTRLVEIYTSDTGTSKVYAKPASLNGNVHIPTCGEHVIVFKALSEDSNSVTTIPQWYYIPMPIAISSGINNNIVLGVTDQSNEVEESYTDVSISPLQIYPGDTLWQGRWGNSLRFSSTTTYENVSKLPTWTQGSDGDPIIILSNTKTNLPDKEYVVEDLNSDYSSLWLTSTQRVTNLNFNIDLTKSNTFSSQFIGVADRVILQSKQDVIALDGKSAIEINSPIVTIGQQSEKEGLLYSDTVVKAFRKVVEIFNSLQAGSTPVSPTPYGTPKILELNSLISEMKNSNIRIDKPQS